MIDLPELANRLNQYGLMDKTFLNMSRTEIELLIAAVFSCPDNTVPANGWASPLINDDCLTIPANCHPKYRWWTAEGQGLLETLIELDAPYSVACKYVSKGMGTPMTEADYLNQTIPF